MNQIAIQKLPLAVRVLDRISGAMVFAAMVVAGIAVAVMILVNSVDTIGRAFFAKPLTGAVEITELFLAMSIILAIPYAQRTMAHIEIDIFIQYFPPKLRRFCSIFTLLITACVYGMLLVQSYEGAVISIKTFEVSAGYLPVPIWLGKVAVTAGFAIALVESLKQIIVSTVFGTALAKDPQIIPA